MHTDGTANINAGGANAASFIYEHDIWFKIAHNIDLDNDWAKLYVGEDIIHEWQWSLQATGQFFCRRTRK